MQCARLQPAAMAASCLSRPQAPAEEEQPAPPRRRAARRLPEVEVALRRLAEAAVVPQQLVQASPAPRSLSAAVQRRRAPPCTTAILWRHCA